jgi:hypothetical protein
MHVIRLADDAAHKPGDQYSAVPDIRKQPLIWRVWQGCIQREPSSK